MHFAPKKALYKSIQTHSLSRPTEFANNIQLYKSEKKEKERWGKWQGERKIELKMSSSLLNSAGHVD